MYYQKIYLPFDAAGFYYPRDDEEQERDKRRIYNMYPETAKRLYPVIEETCDRLEQSGGFLFDEYPDQLQLQMACRRICREVQQENDAEDVLMDICRILFYHEMYLRRCKHREQRNQRFY